MAAASPSHPMVSPMLLESAFHFFTHYFTRFVDPDRALYSPRTIQSAPQAFSIHGTLHVHTHIHIRNLPVLCVSILLLLSSPSLTPSFPFLPYFSLSFPPSFPTLLPSFAPSLLHLLTHNPLSLSLSLLKQEKNSSPCWSSYSALPFPLSGHCH